MGDICFCNHEDTDHANGRLRCQVTDCLCNRFKKYESGTPGPVRLKRMLPLRRVP